MRNRPGVRRVTRRPKISLHLVRPTDVEVLPDDRLEEEPPRARLVQDLGQGELGLQDRAVVAIPGLVVRGRERGGQPVEPLAEEGVDLGDGQPVAQGLEAAGGGTGEDPIV